MTFASDIAATLADVRAIPGALGLRPWSVSLRVVSYDGAMHTPAVEAATEDVAITPTPKVVPLPQGSDSWLSYAAVLGSMGATPRLMWRIGPITNGSGGTGQYVPDDFLAPDGSGASTTRRVLLRITGPDVPDGVDAKVIAIDDPTSLHFYLVAATTEATA